MLVLSRKRNQTIKINDDITIIVLGFDRNRNRVKLGIEAPKEVIVHRGELRRAIQEGKPAT